ncbi:hypothetical protein AXG55_03355 [Silvanigrella aquatica]|uniref:Tryptophan synthase beta chain-like PALP domain-containing protein n=1 Tax=Silvanigrella aquatica TaxID=1915309 RepID=A0A1L4D4C4_9BACT|nr:hypothetical protein AXG55_03355 [Silvanigrella aquatica]
MKFKVNSYFLENYPQQSRIHKLKNFISEEKNIYIKRDDELGFGASGSKIRKYLSLIPFLVKKDYQEVIIIGGPYSNNVLTAAQLLTENNIKPIVFIPKNKKYKITGNFLLSSLILNETSIIYFDDSEKLQDKIELYIREKKINNIDVGIISEGANMKESLPGAITLALDIFRNELESNLEFSHIFLDSGSGLMAIATLLAFSFLNKQTKLHIVQIAGDENEFLKELEIHRKNFENIFQLEIKHLSPFYLYSPNVAKSFGATNATVFKTILSMGRTNGILLDPIYSAKLFFEGKKIIIDNQLKGNLLFVHSGGGLSLFGFEEKLQKYIH